MNIFSKGYTHLHEAANIEPRSIQKPCIWLNLFFPVQKGFRMDQITSNPCPACGYLLSFTPWIDDSPADEICPCCGIQFGYDDSGYPDQASRQHIYATWRRKWISLGMQWHSIGIPAPSNWNPVVQLKKAAMA